MSQGLGLALQGGGRTSPLGTPCQPPQRQPCGQARQDQRCQDNSHPHPEHAPGLTSFPSSPNPTRGSTRCLSEARTELNLGGSKGADGQSWRARGGLAERGQSRLAKMGRGLPGGAGGAAETTRPPGTGGAQGRAVRLMQDHIRGWSSGLKASGIVNLGHSHSDGAKLILKEPHWGCRVERLCRAIRLPGTPSHQPGAALPSFWLPRRGGQLKSKLAHSPRPPQGPGPQPGSKQELPEDLKRKLLMLGPPG